MRATEDSDLSAEYQSLFEELGPLVAALDQRQADADDAQADATTWVYALISSLPREQVQAVCRRCEEIQAELRQPRVLAAGPLVSRVT